ncbi:unnamed protein product [Pleuronectes platessa]|uniref:Uncharacterized protein n=1 Tax=Pleuronectes platessa TaxID=8262 RepID=A0A9N7VLU2_PLEPL|nr:unnamed protein product [Pleuronectes platessa]
MDQPPDLKALEKAKERRRRSRERAERKRKPYLRWAASHQHTLCTVKLLRLSPGRRNYADLSLAYCKALRLPLSKAPYSPNICSPCRWSLTALCFLHQMASEPYGRAQIKSIRCQRLPRPVDYYPTEGVHSSVFV